MLVQFEVSNFRSLLDKQTFSVVAGQGKEHIASHTIEAPVLGESRLLRTNAIFGPNASGKSNVLMALAAMRRIVLTSAHDRQRGDPIAPIEPFRLQTEAVSRPTEFEVVFYQLGTRYQYGFAATRERIVEEWLYAFPRKRSQRWFERRIGRDGNDVFDLGEKLVGPRQIIVDATRPNALFLSTAVQLNNRALAPVFDWFRETLLHTDLDRLPPFESSRLCIEDANARTAIVELLRAADVGIEEVLIEEATDGEVPEVIKDLFTERGQKALLRQPDIKFRHTGASGDESLIDLSDESAGTQKIFSLSGPIYNVLAGGRILAIDELSTSLHPELVRSIIGLFQDSQTNPNGAQLLFTTHDTSLLDQKLMRRDQFWFTQKDKRGSTHLFPLTDFSPRKDSENLEMNYRRGRYGAMPFPQLSRAIRSHRVSELTNGKESKS